LLHRYISPQRLRPLLIHHHDHTGSEKATVATYEVIEVLKNCQAVLCHADSEIIGVVLPHNSPGTSGSPIAQRLSF
jgi:hypothetical protein